MLESELQFNYLWGKHFGAPRIEEGILKPEEQAVNNFFLQSFGKNHLNLKNIVSVGADVARRYLGFLSSSFFIIFLFFEGIISDFNSFLQTKWPRN